MSGKPKVYSQLLQQLHQSSDIDQVLQILEELKGLRKSGELSVKDSYDLQAYGFRTLRELTIEASDTAEEIILERLLPQCLLICPDASMELYYHRECLADWIDQYPEDVRVDLRDKVLNRVYPQLESSEPLAACRIVSRIGYRSDEIVEALWCIVGENDNKVGDAAIETLVFLGVPYAERESVLQEVHRRAEHRYTLALVSALTRLADPSSVETATLWLTSDQNQLSATGVSLVFNLFRAILDVNGDKSALQDYVWKLLADLAQERPSELSHEFYLGHTAPGCDSPLVAATMIDWLATEGGGKGDPAWGRYLLGSRLEECVRPRQLAGWKSVHNATAFKLLKQDACQDTGADLYVTAKEDMVKKKAWETVLRAGHADALNWFNEAVVPETGRFLQQRVMEWLALFRFETLPETVVDWITEECDRKTDEKDSREFMRRMAATRMARSSASREAFSALLDFGFTSAGKAMMQSVYALAEVALHLIREGDTSVVDDLVEVVISRTEEHQRTAAAYALERIATLENSPLLKHAERIVPALYDSTREAYERGTLISALGYLRDWELPEALVQGMKAWAREPDKWMGGCSLEALGHHGYLHDDHHLLTQVLGLRQTDDGWDLTSGVERFEWAPHSIGLLYHYHPQAFSPAIASLILGLDWLSVPQVFDWLRYTHGRSDQSELPRNIKDALIQRVYNTQSSVHSETEVFQMLGQLAPQELAEEHWEDSWDTWLSDSRVALADALGEAELEVGLHSQIISQLQLLARDGQYKVRRSAYRGLARQSMDSLHRLCLSWSVASSVELRQRAAETCGWLDRTSDGDQTNAFLDLYQTLVTDREKPVREAAQKAWEQRRTRLWARQYLSIVIETKGLTNGEILQAWRYGEALARIGDDSCLRVLRRHLSEKALPPNVRFWIEQIAEKIKDNWLKETQKWPEPWFAWEGAIEEGEGKIRDSTGKVLEIQYSVWSQPSSRPSGPPRSEWGGAAWPVPTSVALHLDVETIELDNGRRGRIIAKSASGSTVVFLGSGHYPR